MRLLIVTQKVDINDDNLGSFHGWIKKISNLVDVDVIANYVGGYELPGNVRVFSLGKEKGVNKIIKILKYQWLLLKLLPKSNGIFFHMCPEYVLGAHLLPKIFGKKTSLWYTHKSVNWKLKLAEKLVDKIFTASKESFRLPSEKVEVTGHGIDVDKFKPVKTNEISLKFKIISVSRISPVKNIHLLIEVAEILKSRTFFSQNGQAPGWEIKIAGAPILENDKTYFEKLKRTVKEKKLEDIIEFVGPISNKNIEEFYQNGDLFVNFSDTGSVDRAVLEAMACGVPAITSNEALRAVFGYDASILMFPSGSANECAERIKGVQALSFGDYLALTRRLRASVKKDHNIEILVPRILSFYTQTLGR